MLSKNSVIMLDQVTKRYYLHRHKTLKEGFPGLFKPKYQKKPFYALNDISLDFKQGATGIIGPNGSGKSSLLKLIAGVSKPTSGKVKVKGRVASLTELGAGFHPELTGKENIFLNGTILGLSREEITNQYEAITDFAGIGYFIDEPVKTYSSGMYLRLAFSIAVHTNPDILLVDEILTVGDQQFAEKCMALMSKLKQTKTIVLVTHNLDQIQNFCDRVIYLRKGSVVDDGQPKGVIQKYLDDIS
ncbi:ABC transporter ATP-binding protein [Candidatus Microgenomates bacterium]|nr:MAG: ABC transporter ATP-binding protein [Candidatus Microgenomates bacterium]